MNSVTTLALSGFSERKKCKGKPYGKSNHRKVLRMADEMADAAKEAAKSLEIFASKNIPDWAGLAWIISPYYNWRHNEIKKAMGDEWTKRAEIIVKALRR